MNERVPTVRYRTDSPVEGTEYHDAVPVHQLPQRHCHRHANGEHGYPHPFKVRAVIDGVEGEVPAHCNPEPFTREERIEQYERRIDVQICQREYWYTKDRRRLLLTDMSCRYKANVHAFLLRRARSIEWSYALNHFVVSWDMSDMASDGLESALAEHQAFVDQVGATQWLREMPLLRELLYQSRARDYDGPID